MLRKVTIQFDTHNDNKDDDSSVQVFLKNRQPDSSRADSNPDFVNNLLSLAHFGTTGTLDDEGPNPYLAWGRDLGMGSEFNDPSSKTFELSLAAANIGVNDVVLPEVDIHLLTTGNDRWIFDYTVMLQFDEGTYSFTSKVNGVTGIILDQDNRHYTGIGTPNPFRDTSRDYTVTAATGALLSRVTLEFATHNDDRDHDTRVNVHLTNRLATGQEQDILVALDLLHGQTLPDSGTRDDKYRKVTWSAAENQLASRNITLASMVLPLLYIVIYPNGNDRWIFDYQLTLEFVDPAAANPKPMIYSTRRNGVILDQDNNKHVGVYAGRSFPKVTPPTAPLLTPAPINRTGPNAKRISVAFLQSKLDELVSNRNGPLGSANPSLESITLHSTWNGHSVESSGLPESYIDVGRLINGGDGSPRYVHSGLSLGQLREADGLAQFFFNQVESAKLTMAIDPNSKTPFTVHLEFKPGDNKVWGNHWGWINFDAFSVDLLFTLKKRQTTDNNRRTISVVDLMAWVDELENIKATVASAGGQQILYRYTGTFLGQPFDTTTPASFDSFKASLLEQVVKVHLTTGSWSDPGGTLRQHIRDTLYSKIKDIDTLSNRSMRDGVNAFVTSWLAGGVADDPENIDNNNVFINDVGIKDGYIVVDFKGPQNVFAPAVPAGWPHKDAAGGAIDFSPSTLANIDHIIVLTKENRSFDHMLGYLSLPVAKGGMGRADVDGLKGGELNVYKGQVFKSFELAGTRFAPGTPNNHESTERSIDGGRMDGFATVHAEKNGDAYAGQVMGYHPGRHVPAFDAIARDFTIGHRWFCSHPGPTFPNRFYQLTGRMNLDAHGFWEMENSSPIRAVFTPTIFDHLSKANVSWRYFEYGYCTLRFYCDHTFDGDNIVSYHDPAKGFLACARSGALPSVSFIDPHFVDFAPGSNCDEPPSDIADGQAHVKEIVEAVVAGPAWDKTLLVITYDEAGGFYDHVAPPKAPRVSPDLGIDTVGARIPTLIVSPWVKAGGVFGNGQDGRVFDATSILKTIARRFLSNNPPYMGARYAAAADLSSVLETTPRKPAFLPFIPYRLQFGVSQLMLDVEGGATAAGTPLWQYAANGTAAQDFSFEDAGGGFFYLRSHVSGLYLTAASSHIGGVSAAAMGMAAVPQSDVAAKATVKIATTVTATTVTATAITAPPGSAPAGPVVIQDVKYSPPRQVADAFAPRPEQQRWKLGSASITVQDRGLYVISNQAYPDLLLQPRDLHAPQSPVGLDRPQPGRLGPRSPLAWKVSSPLISDAIMTNTL